MKLEDVRRDYDLQQLDREQLADDPILQFESWFKDVQSANLSDPTAMTLASCDAMGRSSQRTVLLKEFSPRGFVFYTNLQSRKARQLKANPYCSLHFSWLLLERQVVVEGKIDYLTAAENETYFRSRPKESQLAAWASAQSQPIRDREALDRQYKAREEEFSGEIPVPPFWGGIIVRPDYMEFWQGRTSRLHDRFSYQRQGNKWTLSRLQP